MASGGRPGQGAGLMAWGFHRSSSEGMDVYVVSTRHEHPDRGSQVKE